MNNPEIHSPLQQEDILLVEKIDEMISTDTDNSAELKPLLDALSTRLKTIFGENKVTKIVELGNGISTNPQETTVNKSGDLVVAIAILSTIVDNISKPDQPIQRSDIRELFTGVVKALKIEP